jgi:hypothetical protein
MSEPTTDEKIQLLVRSVLEAVDSRLDAVRHEVAVFAADVEERHHRLLGTIAEFERRVTTLEREERNDHTSAADVTERLDEMSARLDLLATAAIDRPTSQAPSGMPRPDTTAPSTSTTSTTAAATPSPLDAMARHDLSQPSDLSAISRPLFDHAHVTTQVPIVPEHSIHRISALPIPAAVTPTMYSPPGMSAAAAVQSVAPTTDVDLARELGGHDDDGHDDHDEEIDLDQLTALLTERLGHLSLPPRPE